MHHLTAESTQHLTQEQAETFCQLPLKGLVRTYPNHILHLLNDENDIQSPKNLHPVFYGCYDWHSAVHGFWLLAKCAEQFKTLNCTTEIVNLFDTHFTTDNFKTETQYFLAKGRECFERPYGWGWLFELANALKSWQHPKATIWLAAMAPLLTQIRTLLSAFLPQQQFPVRTGSHSNTAFSLILIVQYAQRNNDVQLQKLITDAAMSYYLNDTFYPSEYEPSGDDFLSAALCSAVLMAKVLDENVFQNWFACYLPTEKIKHLLTPITITNTNDPKIVHLVGLNLSRAWCFNALAKHCSNDQKIQQTFKDAAYAHIHMSLPHVINGNYIGEHWLASFVLLAME